MRLSYTWNLCKAKVKKKNRTATTTIKLYYSTFFSTHKQNRTLNSIRWALININKYTKVCKQSDAITSFTCTYRSIITRDYNWLMQSSANYLSLSEKYDRKYILPKWLILYNKTLILVLCNLSIIYSLVLTLYLFKTTQVACATEIFFGKQDCTVTAD